MYILSFPQLNKKVNMRNNYVNVFMAIILCVFTARPFDCKNKVQEYQWDAYIQAIQAASPFIGKGQPMVVYGYLDREPRDTISAGMMPFVILTSDGRIYTRIPEDDNMPSLATRCFKNQRNNIYKTRECVNPMIDSLNKCSNMFRNEEYMDCIITISDRESQRVPVDNNFISRFQGEIFYAMIDEDGRLHGASALPIHMVPPFNEDFINIMQLHMLFNVLINFEDKNLRIDLIQRYNRSHYYDTNLKGPDAILPKLLNK